MNNPKTNDRIAILSADNLTDEQRNMIIDLYKELTDTIKKIIELKKELNKTNDEYIELANNYSKQTETLLELLKLHKQQDTLFKSISSKNDMSQ